MIAMAIANDPDVLIADEPTTALDVTVQAQILDVIERIREEMNTAIVMITHDLGVVARVADRVQVMYAGRVVERTDVQRRCSRTRRTRTRWACCNSIPRHGQERLVPIPGRRRTCCGRRRAARSARAACTRTDVCACRSARAACRSGRLDDGVRARRRARSRRVTAS